MSAWIGVSLIFLSSRAISRQFFLPVKTTTTKQQQQENTKISKITEEETEQFIELVRENVPLTK